MNNKKNSMYKTTSLSPHTTGVAALRAFVFLAASSLAVPAANAQLMAPGGTFPVGTDPYDVAVGDLNMDGVPDLAVANSTDTNVSILLGNGDGTFAPQQLISPGTFAFTIALAIADFNADGRPDLAVITASMTISIFLGDGLGGFAPPTAFPTGLAAETLAVGDLNGDGVLDIAVANANGNTVSILLGAGDGTFTFQELPTFSIEPYTVVMGDLNADGVLDLAVSNIMSNNFTVMFGAGNGTFPTHQLVAVGSAVYSLAIADLDGDGDQDVVTTTNTIGTFISVFLNNGTGVFAAPLNFSVGAAGAQEVVVADFDGDGSPDIAAVIPGNASGDVRILLGHGDGTFATPMIFPVGVTPIDLAVADFDSDGDLDVVASNMSSNNVSILLNTTSAPTPINPADFNGDGSVNAADLATLLALWGPCLPAPASCPADIAGTGDGIINAGDLAALLANWG